MAATLLLSIDIPDNEIDNYKLFIHQTKPMKDENGDIIENPTNAQLKDHHEEFVCETLNQKYNKWKREQPNLGDPIVPTPDP